MESEAARQHRLEYKRRYYREHREKMNAQCREYYAKRRAYWREHPDEHIAHLDHVNEVARKRYRKKRYAEIERELAGTEAGGDVR